MTDDDLDRHIRSIIVREGGWVNDPDDSGGPTNYGITLETLRAYFKDMGFPGVPTMVTLKSLSPSTADGIYRWYFRTQGLAELIDEFDVPEELVPLVMDLRTLHSLEGCREILSDARAAVCQDCHEATKYVVGTSVFETEEGARRRLGHHGGAVGGVARVAG